METRLWLAGMSAFAGLALVGAPRPVEAEMLTIRTSPVDGAPQSMSIRSNGSVRGGGEQDLPIREGGAGDDDQHIYWSFGLDGAGLTYSAATLSFHLDGSRHASGISDEYFTVWGLTDEAAGANGAAGFGDNWSFGGANAIAWSNAPANDTAAQGGVVEADVIQIAALTGVTLGRAGEVVIDSDAFPDLLTFLNADTNAIATFIITGGDGTIYFAGAGRKYDPDGGNNPLPAINLEPVLSVTEVPEPASLALLAIAAPGMLLRRGRRGRAL